VSTRLVKNSKKNKSHLQSSVRYHRQIIDAMKAKDKTLTCRLMKEHVRKALDVLLSMPDLQEKNAEETPHSATVMG
jgi:DNA-binding GntR family transcriptional regulator